MTLAFLIPGPIDQLTGGYIFTRRIVEGLRGLGRAVEVIELPGRYPDADDVARSAAAHALSGLPAGSIGVIDGLALPGFVQCLAGEAQRLRLIGFIHHPLSLETGLGLAEARRYAEIEAQLWPLLRGALCPGASTARALIAAGLPPHRVVVAIPGTDKPARLTPAGRGGPLRLLSVATITPRKGHVLLVEALAGLCEHDWRLTCIGSLERDPAEAAALRRAIAARNLGDRIILAGERPQASLSAAYQDADIFVLPSYHEGYGMAYAQALAYGLPVVGTTAGAIPDTVPAAASILVPPGDVAALREALRRLLADEPLRARLGEHAARAATALPDWPTAARNWAAALDRSVADQEP